MMGQPTHAHSHRYVHAQCHPKCGMPWPALNLPRRLFTKLCSSSLLICSHTLPWYVKNILVGRVPSFTLLRDLLRCIVLLVQRRIYSKRNTYATHSYSPAWYSTAPHSFLRGTRITPQALACRCVVSPSPRLCCTTYAGT